MLKERFIAAGGGGMSTADPYQRFCLLRSSTLRAFQEWAETNPTPNDVAEELEGTVGAFWGIATTTGAARLAGKQ